MDQPAPTQTARIHWLIALPLLLVGVGALVGGGYLTWSTITAKSNHEQTEGVVIRNVETKSTGPPPPPRPGRGPASRGPHFTPEVEYEVAGVKHRIRGHVSSSSPSYAIGDKVAVSYPANDPKDGRIDSISENWLAPLVVGGIGLIFTLIGAAALWSWRKPKTSPTA